MTVRTTDPETSRLGAEHIAEKVIPMRLLFLVTLNKCKRPRTASEVAHIASCGRPVTAESIRKRARELFDEDLIAKRGARRCGVSGKQAETYEVTAKGRKKL